MATPQAHSHSTLSTQLAPHLSNSLLGPQQPPGHTQYYSVTRDQQPVGRAASFRTYPYNYG